MGIVFKIVFAVRVVPLRWMALHVNIQTYININNKYVLFMFII